MNGYYVQHISYNATKPFILDIHYAKRMPSISYSFGLFYKEKLVGVVTFGQPPSPTLSASIAGKQFKNKVIELNRLVLKNNLKNEGSFLISKSIKLLKKPTIIVSFADQNQNHLGILYQATNFIYTGATLNNYQFIDCKGKEFHFRKIGHYQKDNKIKVNLVKRRIDEDKINRKDIAIFLRNNKKNFKNKDLDTIFGYKDTAAHWFRLDKGFSFPKVDDWIKLKTILGFNDTYDLQMMNYKLVADRNEIIKKLNLRKIEIKGKHRYIYIHADKNDKKQIFNSFKLPLKQYPKNLID